MTVSAGAVQSVTVSGLTDLIVTLSGVSDETCLTMSFLGITDLNGNNLIGDADIQMVSLKGDIIADGVVDSLDDNEVRAQSGSATVTVNNFRSDTNVSGSVNATDISMVRAFLGNSASCP